MDNYTTGTGRLRNDVQIPGGVDVEPDGMPDPAKLPSTRAFERRLRDTGKYSRNEAKVFASKYSKNIANYTANYQKKKDERIMEIKDQIQKIKNKFGQFQQQELYNALASTKAGLQDRLNALDKIPEADFTAQNEAEERQILAAIKELNPEIKEAWGTCPEDEGGTPLALQMGEGSGHVTTPDGYGAVARTGGQKNNRLYQNMFNVRTLQNGQFSSGDELLRAIDSGRFDPRLEVLNTAVEGIPSSGGFSVPTQFASEWLDASLPNEIVRNLCKIYPMTSQTKEIPGWDGADMSGAATHGGLTMEFLAEGAAGTKQTPKMRKIILTANTAGIYVDASLELVQDGRDFVTNLETALKKSIGYGIDKFCLTGTGAGCPQGVLNAACKVQVQKEGGQAADTIVYSNLKKIFARQINPQGATWLFNPTAIPELLEQSVSVGTGGSFVPLMNEKDGKFTIFGRPVRFHPSIPALGNENDCAFVDFNFYALGLRSDMIISHSDAPRWNYREKSFRILMRFDGMCTLSTAVTPENGDTLSPVVTLAERA